MSVTTTAVFVMMISLAYLVPRPRTTKDQNPSDCCNGGVAGRGKPRFGEAHQISRSQSKKEDEATDEQDRSASLRKTRKKCENAKATHTHITCQGRPTDQDLAMPWAKRMDKPIGSSRCTECPDCRMRPV